MLALTQAAPTRPGAVFAPAKASRVHKHRVIRDLARARATLLFWLFTRLSRLKPLSHFPVSTPSHFSPSPHRQLQPHPEQLVAVAGERPSCTSSSAACIADRLPASGWIASPSRVGTSAHPRLHQVNDVRPLPATPPRPRAYPRWRHHCASRASRGSCPGTSSDPDRPSDTRPSRG